MDFRSFSKIKAIASLIQESSVIDTENSFTIPVLSLKVSFLTTHPFSR